MYDPFEQSEALIRDLPHVRVLRRTPADGLRCVYEKTYKPEGLPEADYWARRENALLRGFALRGLRYTVEPVEEVSDGRRVATYDAGITLEDWLLVRPGYSGGEPLAHPFQRGDQFLKLLRALMCALNEIHALGIMHCDLKPENICLPYTPQASGSEALSIAFERIKLIDFAFAISPDAPLERPLPLLPTADYQSRRLKNAVFSDFGKHRGFMAQQLSWRSDFYSLGHLAGRIAGVGLQPPPCAQGIPATRGAYELARRLQMYARRGKPDYMPYEMMIAEIDRWLEQLGDCNQTFSRLPPAKDKAKTVFKPTPPTPVALLGQAPKPKTRWPLSTVRWLVAAGLAGAVAMAGMYAFLRFPLLGTWLRQASDTLVAARAPQASGPLAEAEWLYQQKDYAHAFPAYRKLAEAGDTVAQCRLAWMYEQGQSVPKDDSKAVQWYRQAAEQGSAAGQASLGYMYLLGKGVEKDESQALAWLRKAAEQGEPRGQSNLGAMYRLGQGGLARNDAQAAEWFRKAAQQGHANSQFNLAILYEEGIGVEKDPAKAKEWFAKAATQGHPQALAKLKRLLEREQKR